MFRLIRQIALGNGELKASLTCLIMGLLLLECAKPPLREEPACSVARGPPQEQKPWLHQLIEGS